MAFTASDVRQCCIRGLQLCVIVCPVILLPIGCSADSSYSSDIATQQIPDKETYLLSQLNIRFKDPDIHSELGRYYLSEGLLGKAKYHLETALSFDPGHRQAQAAFIKLIQLQNGDAKAEETFRQFQRLLLQSPSELIKLANALREEELDQFALDCYTKAIQLKPESAEAHRQLAYFYLGQDDKTNALKHFTRSFELNPHQPDVAGELGRMGVVIQTPGIQQSNDSPDKTSQSSG